MNLLRSPGSPHRPSTAFLRRDVVLAIALIAVAPGCGRPPGPSFDGMPRLPTVPVAGSVRYRNQPVADASLAMQSLDGTIAARGRTDAAGRFDTLSTYGTADGVPPGRYRVMVAVSGVREIEPGVLAPEPPGGFVSPIPKKYATLDSTDLEVDVGATGETDLLIDLK